MLRPLKNRFRVQREGPKLPKSPRWGCEIEGVEAMAWILTRSCVGPSTAVAADGVKQSRNYGLQAMAGGVHWSPVPAWDGMA